MGFTDRWEKRGRVRAFSFAWTGGMERNKGKREREGGLTVSERVGRGREARKEGF